MGCGPSVAVAPSVDDDGPTTPNTHSAQVKATVIAVAPSPAKVAPPAAKDAPPAATAEAVKVAPQAATAEVTPAENSGTSSVDATSTNTVPATASGEVPAAQYPPRARRASLHDNMKVTEMYTLGKVLGKGGFGEVRAAARKLDGKRFAVKIISKLKFCSEEDRTNMVTEVELMRRVRGHRNVVNYVEAFEDKVNFAIVCELCTGGELMERIIGATTFSEHDASCYFKQMASGVKHCHDHLVVHRDLKPENFLFHSPDPASEMALMDFGLSCSIASPDEVLTEGLGSAYYIAPEVFKRRYTKEVDVWSLGVILYLLLCGEVPFGHDAQSESEVYRAIQETPLRFGPFWNGVTSAARELVRGLLEKDPAKRYTIEQALAHPWVAGAGVAHTAPLDRVLFSSLLTFNNKNKLRRNVLAAVAEKLSANDVRQLREAFCKIDADNTGFITYAELKAALREAHMGDASDAEVASMLSSMDADGDGSISWGEFLQATAERQMVNFQHQIWETFCELDTDNSGSISAEELRKIMKHEPVEVIEKYIKEFDTDGDGTICYEEFMRMLLPKDIKFKIARNQ